MKKQPIILNLVQTHLKYDFLEVFFDIDKIKLEDALALKLPESMDRTRGIIINGRGPIWLYLILYRKIKESNSARWVAQFDPQLKGAAKIETKGIKNSLIKISEFEEFIPLPDKNMVIAFIGPPHSGKSVFLFSLFKQLIKKNPKYTNNNIFLVKGCPDGEGLWISDLPESLVQVIRYKNKFSKVFIKRVIEQIENTKRSKKIVFVDCGGRIDSSNDQILSKCTHAILIAADTEKAAEWKEKYNTIKYLAEIVSIRDATDKVSRIKHLENDTFHMDMINLDRNNPDIQIPEELLQFLLSY